VQAVCAGSSNGSCEGRSEVQANDETALLHLKGFGVHQDQGENMQRMNLVDDSNCQWQCYLDRYPGIANVVGAHNIAGAKRHWLTHGEKEGRDCTCSPPVCNRSTQDTCHKFDNSPAECKGARMLRKRVFLPCVVRHDLTCKPDAHSKSTCKQSGAGGSHPRGRLYWDDDDDDWPPMPAPTPAPTPAPRCDKKCLDGSCCIEMGDKCVCPLNMTLYEGVGSGDCSFALWYYNSECYKQYGAPLPYRNWAETDREFNIKDEWNPDFPSSISIKGKGCKTITIVEEGRAKDNKDSLALTFPAKLEKEYERKYGTYRYKQVFDVGVASSKLGVNRRRYSGDVVKANSGYEVCIELPYALNHDVGKVYVEVGKAYSPAPERTACNSGQDYQLQCIDNGEGQENLYSCKSEGMDIAELVEICPLGCTDDGKAEAFCSKKCDIDLDKWGGAGHYCIDGRLYGCAEQGEMANYQHSDCGGYGCKTKPSGQNDFCIPWYFVS